MKNDKFSKVSYALLLFLGASMLVFTSSRTVRLVQSTLPADAQSQAYIALAALDGGLLIWLMIYIHLARGSWQRAISGGLVLICLSGVGIASAADTFLQSAKNGLTGGLDPDTVGTIDWLIWGIIFANVAGIVAMHLTDPKRLLMQAEEDAADYIEEEAIKQIRAGGRQIAGKLAQAKRTNWEKDTEARYQFTSGSAPQLPSPPPALPVAKGGSKKSDFLSLNGLTLTGSRLEVKTRNGKNGNGHHAPLQGEEDNQN